MEDVDTLLGAVAHGIGSEGGGGEGGPLPAARGSALAQHVRSAHRAQVADQGGEAGIAQRHPINIDHRHDETRSGEQRGECRGSDTRMGARRGGARHAVGGEHRAAQCGEAVAPGERADERTVGAQSLADRGQCRAELVDGVERADGDDEVEAFSAVSVAVLLGAGGLGSAGEEGAGVERLDVVGNSAEPLEPVGVGNADQQSALEAALNVAEPVEALGEGPFVEEEFGTCTRRAIATQCAKAAVEQIGGRGSAHSAACAMTWHTRQGGMATILQSTSKTLATIKMIAGRVLDFALPPRCAGCAEIIDELHSFCTECWLTLDWLGNAGCERCGMPLEATDAALCGRCLAAPPPLDRMRAAVVYGPLSRVIALKLKYGRKVALARTMARYMAPLRGPEDDALLVPVPLHRRRLWWRGFNQSGLVAKQLAAQWDMPVDQELLRRVRPTPPLKGMNETQRRNAVRGAFVAVEGRLINGRGIEGRTVILIDDVLTTGSTAEACATALRKVGARRVELISWARVVRPSHLMR